MKKLLVDQVEDQLFDYFQRHNYHVGDLIPGETFLSEELGVARSVLREALSRFKLVGLITSRPRIGMRLTEPQMFAGLKTYLDPRYYSEKTLLDMVEMRMIIEIGWARMIASKMSDSYIDELEKHLTANVDNTDDINTWEFEYNFHRTLYEEMPNAVFSEFQNLLYTGMTYTHKINRHKLADVNKRLLEQGITVGTHQEILKAFRTHDPEQAAQAVVNHFIPYTIFIKEERERIKADEEAMKEES